VAAARRPRVAILSGTGPWSDPSGLRQGTVTVTIDLARGTFSGSLNASRRTSSGTILYTGTFSGQYAGDEQVGTLNGGGTVQMRTAKSASTFQYHITGHQQNYIVRGDATHSRDSFPFGVTLRQVR
jgi:hypothetical protein